MAISRKPKTALGTEGVLYNIVKKCNIIPQNDKTSMTTYDIQAKKKCYRQLKTIISSIFLKYNRRLLDMINKETTDVPKKFDNTNIIEADNANNRLMINGDSILINNVLSELLKLYKIDGKGGYMDVLKIIGNEKIGIGSYFLYPNTNSKCTFWGKELITEIKKMIEIQQMWCVPELYWDEKEKEKQGDVKSN